MKYLKSFMILLAVFVVASTFLVPVDSSNPPPEPDDANVENFKEWMDVGEKANMNPAAEDVKEAYNNLSGLVNAYRDALRGVGGSTYSSVSGSVQTSWVSMIMSLYDKSIVVATAIAKSQSLESAVELAASHHSTYWHNYHELYDGHGTVTQGTVAEQVNREIAERGGIRVDASTMMEAYWKYEFIVRDYNATVDRWNAYAPSQAKFHRWTTEPNKVEFTKFKCFGGCGYNHDLLDYARDSP